MQRLTKRIWVQKETLECITEESEKADDRDEWKNRLREGIPYISFIIIIKGQNELGS